MMIIIIIINKTIVLIKTIIYVEINGSNWKRNLLAPVNWYLNKWITENIQGLGRIQWAQCYFTSPEEEKT